MTKPINVQLVTQTQWLYPEGDKSIKSTCSKRQNVCGYCCTKYYVVRGFFSPSFFPFFFFCHVPFSIGYRWVFYGPTGAQLELCALMRPKSSCKTSSQVTLYLDPMRCLLHIIHYFKITSEWRFEASTLTAQLRALWCIQFRFAAAVWENYRLGWWFMRCLIEP